MTDCNASVLLETDLGSFTVDLRGNYAPQAVQEFIRLIECGFYRNNLFFRIEPEFIAVCGDPTGTGRSGSTFQGLIHQARSANDSRTNDLTIPLETAKDDIASTWKGYVLCSLSSPGLNQVPFSQFFITLSLADTPRYDHLRGKHTVIGRVTDDDHNVLAALSRTFIDKKGRPLRDVRMRRTIILVYPAGMEPLDRKSLEALNHLVPNEELDVPSAEWDKIEERPSIFSNEIIDDEEVMLLKKEEILAETRAVELEILGDITSADAKPEDSVLFVCKLNPTTTSEDLRIIFSRFGDVTDCEVKRDPETKESLQYAFIAFKTKEQCEEAYKKMQDVMIDGRRIRVDFSQSEGKRARQIASQNPISGELRDKQSAKNYERRDPEVKRHRHKRSRSEEISSRNDNHKKRGEHRRRNRDARRSRSSSSSSSEDSRRRKHRRERHKTKSRRRSRSRDRRRKS